MTIAEDLVPVAQELIGDEGRSVTLRLETVTNNPTTGAETSTTSDQTVTAAFFDISDGLIDGTNIRAGDRKVLIAAADVSAKPTPEHIIIDGADTWTIARVKEIKPGATPVLYDLLVR